MDGDGTGKAAKTLEHKDHLPLNDKGKMAKVTDAHMFKAIKEGGESVKLSDEMEAFGSKMTDKEIWDVVSTSRPLAK